MMTVAADAMLPPVALSAEDDLRTAVEAMVASSLRELPVLDEAGRILCFLDEADIGKAYLAATERLALAADATPLGRI